MIKVGFRVVRGPHWACQDEDGGEGFMGTVYKINFERETAIVQWDNGYQTICKIGLLRNYELRIIDNAQAGVEHIDSYCNECNNGGIKGTRYKCNDCPSYDLCNSCYHENKHDLDHRFSKFLTPDSKKIDLPPRSTETVSNQHIHASVVCDGCNMINICGSRYRCTICDDYDLCTSCYRGNKHYLTHIFYRTDVPNTKGVLLPPRLDNHQTRGAIHIGIKCNACNIPSIVGIRYKCNYCWSYDLCNECYRRNIHEMNHSFKRIDSPRAPKIDMPPRSICKEYEGGAIYEDVHCDECKKYVIGIRYKCNDCFNYDLCYKCYSQNHHNFGHSFIKFDFPHAMGTHAAPRTATAIPEQREAIHRGVFCNECYFKNRIYGIRYKCNNCINYDLCSLCYHEGRHNLNHNFTRINTPESIGIVLPIREGSRRCQLRGISKGAKVIPGIDADWNSQEQFGIVLNIDNWNNSSWRSAAYVRWENGETRMCRLGYQGQCDLQLVEVSPHIRYYYPEHLPPLGQNDILQYFNEAGSSTDNESTSTLEYDLALSNSSETDMSQENISITNLKKELDQMKQRETCSICWERKRNIIFLCGHGACFDCSKLLDVCHMCRERIALRIRIFEN